MERDTDREAEQESMTKWLFKKRTSYIGKNNLINRQYSSTTLNIDPAGLLTAVLKETLKFICCSILLSFLLFYFLKAKASSFDHQD